MKYTVVLEKGRESGFVATVPVLRGCISQGETHEETIANIKEAIEVYLEALQEDGLSLPTEVGVETVEVDVTAA